VHVLTPFTLGAAAGSYFHRLRHFLAALPRIPRVLAACTRLLPDHYRVACLHLLQLASDALSQASAWSLAALLFSSYASSNALLLQPALLQDLQQFSCLEFLTTSSRLHKYASFHSNITAAAVTRQVVYCRVKPGSIISHHVGRFQKTHKVASNFQRPLTCTVEEARSSSD